MVVPGASDVAAAGRGLTRGWGGWPGISLFVRSLGASPCGRLARAGLAFHLARHPQASEARGSVLQAQVSC